MAVRRGVVARRRRYTLAVGGASLAGLGILGFKVATAGVFGIVSVATMIGVQVLINRIVAKPDEGTVIHRFRPGLLPFPDDFALTSRHLDGTRLVSADGGGFDLRVPYERSALGTDDDGREHWVHFSGYLLRGGSRGTVREALGVLDDARDASSFLRRQAEREARVEGEGESRAERRIHRLALEMALHDEQERRALEGELSMLAAAWREAEQIAGIADRLAEAVEPPKYTA